MRYSLALAVAGLLISAGVLFVWLTERSVEQRLRQALRAAKAAGKLPPEIDVETADLGNFGVQLPPAEMFRVSIAQLFISWRFILVLLILLGSLGLAHLLGRERP
jgi:hypothetical protein